MNWTRRFSVVTFLGGDFILSQEAHVAELEDSPLVPSVSLDRELLCLPPEDYL